MDRKIITIGYEIPGFSDRYYDYYSDQSLLDADIVVFEPQEFSSSSERTSYDESGSIQIKENTERWRKELSTALSYGKTVFIIFKKYQIATVRTGQKEFKGSTTINYVTECNNYEFLPIEFPQIIAKGGSEIKFTGNSAFTTFWEEFKDYLKFESYLNEKIDNPVFITKTGDRPVGGFFKVGKGNLVLIPPIKYNNDKFTKHDKKKNIDIWTKPAVDFGNNLVDALLEIDKILRSESQKTPPPSWVGEPIYILDKEAQIVADIKKTSDEIKSLSDRKKTLLSNLEEERQLKDLLFETGKPLENAIVLALKILGYSAENYDDGELELDQIIFSPEKDRFIGESEGKDSAAINIDKFRQLEENIQSDLQRENVNSPATGILFGNGFRLLKPEDRQEQFTKKCLNSAKRGTILIQTTDLFFVAKYLRQNKDEDYAQKCRQAIMAGKGGIVKFPPIPDKIPN